MVFTRKVLKRIYDAFLETDKNMNESIKQIQEIGDEMLDHEISIFDSSERLKRDEAKIFEQSQDAWIYILNKYVKELNNKMVLDAGCGFGGLGIACKKKGANFIGIDISDDVYNARQLSSGQLELLKSDGHNLPFKSDIFDVVASIGTLEHVKKPDVFVIEMLRVLKPNGFAFLFYGPNRKFRWLDNPSHKKIVYKYITYEDIYKTIKPITASINLVWGDIIEYRLYNKNISYPFESKYHDRMRFIFELINKQDFIIKPLCFFCRVLEKISYQPNIALIIQKK